MVVSRICSRLVHIAPGLSSRGGIVVMKGYSHVSPSFYHNGTSLYRDPMRSSAIADPIEYSDDGIDGSGNYLISPPGFPTGLLSALPHLARIIKPAELNGSRPSVPVPPPSFSPLVFSFTSHSLRKSSLFLKWVQNMPTSHVHFPPFCVCLICLCVLLG